MKNLILVFLLLPIMGYARSQDKPYLIGKDTLVTSKGMKFYPGVKVKIGRPSQDRPTFNYLTASPALTALTGSYNNNGFGKDFSGMEMTVKKVKKQTTKKFGDKYFVICTANVQCWIDIENAIETGEVIVPKEYQSASTINASAEGGVADELKKLKGLLDSGILTQAEFDSQKKKLLGL